MQKLLRFTKIALFAFVLTAFLAGSVKADCPAGDLNLDCEVNLQDLQVLAEDWLAPPRQTEGGPWRADLNGDDEVGMVDFAMMADNWCRSHTPVLINEVLASNGGYIIDPQGQYDDWIEIYNAGHEAIDIGGMYLTDDLSVPTMWRIPDDNPSATTIPARGYLLIWADGDTADPGLHANFRLNVGGEELGLFDTDGPTSGALIDTLAFGHQTVNISYGRYPDADDDLRFFGFPTPGGQNDRAYLGVVADTKFSHERGFYDSPFSVTITAETEGATIFYTLNGMVPNDPTYRFFPGKVYSGPIPITKTTCLRAVAIKHGWKPSKLETHTYLLNASAAIKSLPMVSLVGDEGKTFYEPYGVMAIVGGYYGGDGRWVSSGAGSYNNPMTRGYECPVSFELIKPEDNSGFQIDCGIRVHGSDYMRPRYRRSDGFWSGNAKFAFRLYFRGRYGQSWLEYPLFPFEVERFKSIVLRGGHNDRVNPFIKDELIRRLHMDMGHVASGGIMANLFINGEYKGYFNPCEHIKDAFCQEWYESDKEWDVMTMNGIRDGNSTAWNALMNYVRSRDLSNDVHYQEVAKKLDIPNFADYLILQLWSANWDWPQNNWAAAAERSEEEMWRFFIWDAEGGMFSNHLNTVYFDRLNSQGNANGWLYRALKVNEDFKQLFGDRIYKHFYNNGALTAANIRRRFLELRDEMLGVLPNMDMYVHNTWVPNRPSIFLNACISEGMFTFVGPTFYIDGTYQHGGQASAGADLTMINTKGSGTIYYTLDGSDPHLSETSGGGTISSTTLIPENAGKRVLVPTGPISNNWKGGGAFDDSAWALSTGSPGGVGYERGSGYESLINIDVGDQMYGKNATCYVRIPFTVDAGDLAGFNFMTLEIRYDDAFVAYINGVEVDRRNFTGTPQWDSTATSGHDDSAAVMFESVGISDHIDTLRAGTNVLAIHGLNVSTTSSDLLISAKLIAGETSSPSGGGVSPTATKYNAPITLSETTHVKARVLSGSAWSALSEAVYAIGPVAENLRITEIMYHPQDTNDPDDPNREFIELQNTGIETINLNLVRFTNGVDFAFPGMELAAGEYVLVVKNINVFRVQYGPGLNIAGQYSGSLRNGGERIELEDAAGQTILNFRYRDGWYDITDGMGFSLTVKDPVNTEPNACNDKSTWRPSANIGGSPGWDDTDEVPALGTVKINELLAHSHAAASDWIELHNTTGEPIHIGGWFLSDDSDDFMKYEIADGTWIDPCGYVVFYQNEHFGKIADPGCHSSFALSENGETLYLHSGRDHVLTGYSEEEKFGASETGVAFGRYGKSTGTYNFVAMSENTPGLANAYPKVGPIVINEIMYHPQNNGDAEYVELLNISGAAVSLKQWDNEQGEFVPWRFTDEGGITFDFPLGTTMAAGEHILLVRNLGAFESEFGAVDGGVQVFEWELGKLDNGSEKIQLSKPGDEVDGERYYIRVDRVNYSDGSHPVGDDPWPTEADGAGSSLSRKAPTDYGNDVINWKAASPSPGQRNAQIPVRDRQISSRVEGRHCQPCVDIPVSYGLPQDCSDNRSITQVIIFPQLV